MNKEVNLSITTLKVEIKVLVLDGKRFTKSVFDQLQTLSYEDYIKYKWEPIGFCDIGGNRWFLFTSDGMLWKAVIRTWEAPEIEHAYIKMPNPQKPFLSEDFFPDYESLVLHYSSRDYSLSEEAVKSAAMHEVNRRLEYKKWTELGREYVELWNQNESEFNAQREKIYNSLTMKDQIFISI